jgi:hypothetical protein
VNNKNACQLALRMREIELQETLSESEVTVERRQTYERITEKTVSKGIPLRECRERLLSKVADSITEPSETTWGSNITGVQDNLSVRTQAVTILQTCIRRNLQASLPTRPAPHIFDQDRDLIQQITSHRLGGDLLDWTALWRAKRLGMFHLQVKQNLTREETKVLHKMEEALCTLQAVLKRTRALTRRRPTPPVANAALCWRHQLPVGLSEGHVHRRQRMQVCRAHASQHHVGGQHSVASIFGTHQ